MNLGIIVNEKIKNVLIAVLAGDASGYIFEGMKKAHIKSVFKKKEAFPDPEPALKNNMNKWKKPGLYSSLTQFMILNGASIEKKQWNRENFMQMLKDSPELPGLDYSFFRSPDAAGRNLIYMAKNLQLKKDTPFSLPCSNVAPSALPLLYCSENSEDLLFSIIGYSMLFTIDPGTAASGIAMSLLIKDIISSDKNMEIHKASAYSLAKTESFAKEHENIIFSSGINPDYVTSRISLMRNILDKTVNIEKIDDCEKIICEESEKVLQTRIARATTNLPETLFPYAVSIAARCKNPADVFITAAYEGGAASALSSITGAIASAYYSNIIPDELLSGIINRKKILSIIDSISSEKERKIIYNEMILSEPPLTLKELEEYNSKNKKNPDKKNKNKPKTRRDAEAEISKHIVESWTKIDKAKWKKERKRHKT